MLPPHSVFLNVLFFKNNQTYRTDCRTVSSWREAADVLLVFVALIFWISNLSDMKHERISWNELLLRFNGRHETTNWILGTSSFSLFTFYRRHFLRNLSDRFRCFCPDPKHYKHSASMFPPVCYPNTVCWFRVKSSRIQQQFKSLFNKFVSGSNRINLESEFGCFQPI